MANTLDDLDEGWNQNRKLVQAELSRLARAVESLDMKVGGEMTNMKVELATIKTKVMLYAAIVSITASVILSAVLSAVINYLSRQH